MKRPTFLEGAGVAVAASVAGGVLFAALTTVFAGGGALRLIIALVALGYVLYLLSRCRERVGRITVLVLWLLVASALWVLSPPFAIYLLLHVGMIWVIRSLYFYSGVLSSLVDLCLSGLAVAAAVAAGIYTGSVFASLWCFFLTQALFTAIPSGMDRLREHAEHNPADEDRFEQAHRAAEAALRRFSSSL